MTTKDISYFTRSTPRAGNESGRSLVEMLGTIGIITMITVGAISGSNMALDMWKANQAVEQVMEIIQGVTDMYSWNRDGWEDLDGEHAELCINGGFSSCEGDDEKNQIIRLAVGDTPTIEHEGGTKLIINVNNVSYKAYNHIKGKADGKLITSIECVGTKSCNPENRGSKDIRFIHDINAIQ